jgi:hypothetical protein
LRLASLLRVQELRLRRIEWTAGESAGLNRGGWLLFGEQIGRTHLPACNLVGFKLRRLASAYELAANAPVPIRTGCAVLIEVESARLTKPSH